ncbi:MAG: inositol-3-phosphate synthase, partial [Planctomycetota bacterium]
MKTTKLGLWLVGARGGVATTAMLGLFAQRKGLAGPAGLVTELPQFAHLSLPSWEDFVVGGHEIRSGAVIDQLHRFSRQNRVLSADLIDSCAAELRQADDEIRPGMLWQVGPRIAEMSDLPETSIDTTGQAAVDRIQADLSAFQRRHSLDSVVVVNLASTEATPPPDQWPAAWNDVQRQLGRNDCPLPASSLYAIAAFELGFPFVNFTPSLGALPEGIEELALLRGACHAGRDGKTGETLLKSVLAPMFASRNLEVMSWVGHNIFGNLDGKVLDDPRNKSSKVASKDQLLGEILGYSPQSHI